MGENRVRMIRMNREDFTSQDIDYLLVSISNEERCYSVLSILKEKKVKIRNLILFIYEKFEGNVLSKREQIFLDECAQDVRVIRCDKGKEGQATIDLANIGIEKEAKIGFDITGFAIPDIFKILYVLNNIIETSHVDVFYTEPKYYCYQNGIFTTYSRNSGECVYNVIEEYNNTGNGKHEVLVCFLGFDKNVSKYVYDEVVPYETVVVNGFPSYLPKLKDISLLNNYELIATVGSEKVISVRANSPYATYNCLNCMKKKYDEDLLNICVLGTKPMALGAAMFALRNPQRVKVSYAFPEKYKPNSSAEVGDSWCYQINFGGESNENH